MGKKGPLYSKEASATVLALIAATFVAAVCVAHGGYHIIRPYIDALENASIV